MMIDEAQRIKRIHLVPSDNRVSFIRTGLGRSTMYSSGSEAAEFRQQACASSIPRLVRLSLA